jgi:hypothetical protein
MGLAKHNRGGQWRLGLSATAASAVLYSAIVLFGVGSASPSAPAAGRDPRASAVLAQPDAHTLTGSAQRLPQASPEPRRHRLRAPADRRRTGVAPALTSSAPSAVASPTPASPRETESESPGVASPATASVAAAPPVVSVPPLSLPTVTVTVPELPVQLPDVPVPVLVPPPVPVPVPPPLPLPPALP